MASERLRIWLEDKPHSVEGHIYEATLTFNDTIIWGPKTCHDNTVTLREKIHEADNRFDITFTKKDKTIEGHTKYIYVRSNGEDLLSGYSTHDNMAGLIDAIKVAQAINP